ncbi:MAG: translation initiation factor IF-2, partial [Oscillospiraceae bacterium]|nr:translation initiation factor IF-2 [Oscillospiraceae bacterium]
GEGRPGGYGDRPRPYGGSGGEGRPGGYGDRPRPYGGSGGAGRPGGYGDRPRPYGGSGGAGRPGGYGDRPRPFDKDRPGFPGRRMEVPKPELTDAQKDEMNTTRVETRREAQTRENEKGIKREQKKEAPRLGVKTAVGQKDKPFTQKIVLNDRKSGLSDVMKDDFVIEDIIGSSKFRKGPRNKRDSRRGEALRVYQPRAVLTDVVLPEIMTVKEFAEIIKKSSADVLGRLMRMDMKLNVNADIDFAIAELVAETFNIKCEKEVVVSEEDILFDDGEGDEGDYVPRPPVVVVMGHVDHGKTSLLDAIKQTNVTESEAGGITQHIGAYTVSIKGRSITFLDTPGHEAFTALRARGAQITDIAILVVGADDGVMPQTIEAINHAKAAGVTIIVAVNKIDLPGANVEKVKQDLTEYGLVSEEWGGETIFVPVSAKMRTNIDTLLEMVLLTADILELRTDPGMQAKGTVIEARLDRNKGPVTTVLVQRGVLKTGDTIVTGQTVGNIRAMVSDKGSKIKSAGPSTPVEITGLPEVPSAGELFYAVTNEKVARSLAEKRKVKSRVDTLLADKEVIDREGMDKVGLEGMFEKIKKGKVKEVSLVVKADVQGSIEALRQSFAGLSTDEVAVKVVHGAVGSVTSSDVSLAQVTDSIIIGFNVRPTQSVMEQAQGLGVEIRLYRIIYEAIDDIKNAMKGKLDPTYREVVLGRAEVRQIYKASGVGTICGSYITDGKITRNCEVRLVRNGIVVHEGKLASLKRFKDDVREVAQGFECGILIERYNDVKERDVIEGFIIEEVARV